MYKKLFSAQAVAALVLAPLAALSAPPIFVTATVAPSGRTVTIPQRAVEVAPNVFDLGAAIDPASGGPVQGYMIVHRRAGHAKGGTQSGGNASTKCYAYIARGTKWRIAEPWTVNPANTRGLAGEFVVSTLASSVAKWEDAADGITGNGIGENILGNGSATSSALSADTAAPDGKNEVYFADIADIGVIAATIVWYNRLAKTLVEWDQVYDDVSYDWSAAGEAGKFDFENIATHELGHSVGLGDLYNSCTEETMYGYADFGETKKQTLNTGDIAGVNALY